MGRYTAVDAWHVDTSRERNVHAHATLAKAAGNNIAVVTYKWNISRYSYTIDGRFHVGSCESNDTCAFHDECRRQQCAL